MADLRWEKYPSKWLIYNQILTVLLLMAGLLLFSLILYFKPLKAETIIRPVMVLEGIFALLLGTALLSIACCLRKWMQLLQNRIWLLAILGLGLLFIHATADLADNLVIFSIESGLDLLQAAAKLFGVALLVISIGLWIKDLLQTRQRLLASKQDLHESEVKFRTLFELYPDATVLIDPQTALPEEFNRAAHEQLGYSANEFSRMNIADYEALETPEEIEKHIEYIIEHGRDDFETRHLLKNGSSIDVYVTVMHFEINSKDYFLCVFRDITDRKVTIRALEESEQRFHDVAEAAGEYIWEINGQNTYTFLTSRVEELLGHKVKKLLGSSPADFMPPEEAARVKKLLTEWAEKRQSWQGLEHKSIRADGKIVWQRVSGMPIFDHQGQLKGFRGTGLDITAEAEAKQRQQDLANRLRLATEAAKLGIWDLRLSDGYLEWDEGMLRIYGVSQQDFDNSVQYWLDALLPEFREQAPEDLQKGIASGQSYTSEFKIRRGDGEIRHIRAMAQPILDEQGSPVRVVGINEDVTKSKRAEERLHEQERLYRGLVESQQDLIVRVDSQGRFTYVNDAYCRKFNKTRKELLGSSFTPLVHEDDIEATRKAMKDLERPPYRAYIEQRAQTSDGWRWLSWEDSTVLDDKGNILEIQGVGRDITELKEAQRKAEAASLSKSEFLANMSHEIRTPMNAVIGLIQLLLQTPLNDRQRDYLLKINSSSRMLLGIINDILDYSKIEAGKLELDKHTFRMDELLDQMKTLFASAAANKNLEIFFRISPDIPNVLQGDSLRLGQVFTNLLGNAIKFTEKGHVQLLVQRAEQNKQREAETGLSFDNQEFDDQEQVCLRFEVCDTGIGLDKEQISRLFQAFSQADTSTTRKYGGTGLGLVISQKLVERMGGKLGVDSIPGQGSSFFFELDFPVAQEVQDDMQCPELEHNRILVVDDHATARLVLREILESCTFQITEAASGQAAIDAVITADQAGAPFDFIFMDWNLPGELDGLEAIQRIEKMHADEDLSGAKPPVVIVSAYNREDLPEPDKACFNCFLTKPVTASSVFDALAESAGKAPERRGFSPGSIPDFAGSSILLAEDNILNQEVAQQMLEKTGASVTVANNGAEALEMVKAENFNLVLMDLQMPVMDGFEATRKILENSPNLPIIALSAAVMEADRKQAQEAGMLAHLAKPIDSTELYSTLAKWLKVSERAPATETEPRAMPLELPDFLEGFDLQKGLKSADNDADFYLKMLHRFKDQLRTEFALIDEQLQEGEKDNGPRMVHTLKGIAGTVGAVHLAQSARTIDLAFKEGQPISKEIRQDLVQAINAAQNQLASLPVLQTQTVAASSEQEGISAMAELLDLLRKNELVDDELLTSVVNYLQTHLQTYLDGQKPDELVRLVDNFEHDAAASLLVQLAAETGAELK